LYQKYVGHDNNRDGYMLNTHEARVTTRVIRHWEPQVLYNHHQTAPFPARIWIPPFAEPVSPHVHPLMWRTVNLIGMAMAHALEERGQEGAVHMGTGFDNWYPGFLDHANNFHNIASFLTETGLYKYATPHFYELSDFPENARELRPRSLYASPWKGGWWRLGDAVSYMLTASISVLDVAAKYKEDLLFNRYQAGRDVIEMYRREPPFAYFVPQQQRDPVAAVEMLRRLAFNGIEVHRLLEDVDFEGRRHGSGTWVIAMDQPFAHFVRQLFAIQSYPDLREYPEGPPDQPYDITGWTLPLQMGVEVIEATSPLGDDLRALLEPVRGAAVDPDSAIEDATSFDSPLGVGFDSHSTAAGILPPPGRITGSGPAIALDGSQNNAYRFLNAAWAAGASVAFEAGAAPDRDGEGGRPGRFLVRGFDDASAWAERLALRAERTSTTGRKLDRPRIGVYRPWKPSKDEGWTRWLLERYGFEFRNLRNVDFRSADLPRRWDVLLLVDMSPRDLLRGYEAGTVPARYAGGLDREGVRALDAFVRQGGTLVALNDSSRFVIEHLHLPVVDITEDLGATELFL
ncbi:MAG: hypothetical protein MI919_02605, partial [Holophagales bacterium]|nr:hypothetical protein [Holophagales bacterium]